MRQTEKTPIHISALLENQLAATKFFVPGVLGPLICRSRLDSLLQKSLMYPLTLVSAPAGFGKTTQLALWKRSLPAAQRPLVAWVSLEEADNEPRLFWASVLIALDLQYPGRFRPLLSQLQSSQAPPLQYILTALSNLLEDAPLPCLLILDDYHLITEQQIHTTLDRFVSHMSAQLHIILATRTDPPLSLTLRRARQQLLEVRAEHLRCTAEETRAFFQEVVGIQLPQEIVQEVTARTEGWLVGLQLLALSLQGRTNPATLLEEATGDQRYILDYLMEEVLQRQPQEVQTFLLSTCILEHLNASLCDAVTQQQGSQRILEQLVRANLFVVSLDSKGQWYRYHALFAQALRYQLEQTQGDLVVTLHHRASLWYAQQNAPTEAILHALKAREWQWAADLIEGIPFMSLTWGAGEHELVLLRQWLELLPTEVVHARPRLCLACAQMLWAVAPQSRLQAWFDAAEAQLTALLTLQAHEDGSGTIMTPQERQEQENILGEVRAFRAILWSQQGGSQQDGQAILSLCQQALDLLSADNAMVRAQVAYAQFQTYYYYANETEVALACGLQSGSLAKTAGKTALAICMTSLTAMGMLATGRLHEVQRLTRHMMLLSEYPQGFVLPERGCPAIFQAEVLREWNQLDAALKLAEEGIKQCGEAESIAALAFLAYGHAVLLRIHLSREDNDAALCACQQFERMCMDMNQSSASHFQSFFTTIDRVRLWLADGELERAVQWAGRLEISARQGTPFACEREEVACVRICLARAQPVLALQRLEPVLQRAIASQRWGHVIEMRLLQAQAHQMQDEERQALDVLWEAVRLAEPEGYIRSFVEEGPTIATLLHKLRKEQSKGGPTPYLDKLLAACVQQSQIQQRQPRRAQERAEKQQLLDPLSERELQVLQLIVRGAPNQEIAQELVIALDTVKRHVSHIFSKLGVNNRIQAVKRVRELGLLDEDF